MDNLSPLFSIIIPTFNRSSDLERCLNSLVNQTFKKFEVIVCDNASTDNTNDIISKFSSLLNLNYLRLSVNSGGPARPRNIGASVAKGKWLCFLDSDDWYSNNRLEKIVKSDFENYDFIYHRLHIIQNNKILRPSNSRALNRKSPYYDLLYNLNAIPTSSTCIRKTLYENIGGFSEDKAINSLEDFDLWLKIAKNNAKFLYFSECLGFYFLGSDNLSLNDGRKIERLKLFYSRIIESEFNERNKIKINAALNFMIAKTYGECNQYQKGIEYLLQSCLDGSIKLKWKSILRVAYFIFLSIRKQGI